MSFRRKFSLGFSRVVNHLQRSRPGVRHATGAPSYQDAATTMEKLDAALNNMSHGLCMFGPDNRLLLWNDRYVKMYKLAPDSLHVGCTLDEMLEARKAAGTAYRDLGQYGSKLQAAMTTSTAIRPATGFWRSRPQADGGLQRIVPGGSCRRAREHRRRQLKRPVDANRSPLRWKTLQIVCAAPGHPAPRCDRP